MEAVDHVSNSDQCNPTTPPRQRRSRRVRPVIDLLPQPVIGVLDDDLHPINGGNSGGFLDGCTVEPPSHNADEGYWTLPNKFGITRRYYSVPTSIPDENFAFSDLINYHPPGAPAGDAVAASTTTNSPQLLDDGQNPPVLPSLLDQVLDIIHPHPNISAFLMNRWFYRPGSISKSKIDRNLLMKEVILNPSFDPAGLAPPFNFKALDDLLVNGAEGEQPPSLEGAGWRRCDVTIDIPPLGACPRTTWTTKGAYIRSITRVAREVLESPASRSFNWDAFEEWWKPDSTSQAQRVYHNLYASDAFLRAESSYERPNRLATMVHRDEYWD